MAQTPCMNKMLFLFALSCGAPAFADVAVKNSTGNVLNFVVTEKPVTPAQQKLLTKYNYRAFTEAHKVNLMEGGVGPGDARNLNWHSTGNLLVWHFNMDPSKSTFFSVPLVKSDNTLIVTKQGGKFKVKTW